MSLLQYFAADDDIQGVGDRLLLRPEFGGAALVLWVDFDLVAGYAEVDVHLGPHLREDLDVERLEERCLEKAHI